MKAMLALAVGLTLPVPAGPATAHAAAANGAAGVIVDPPALPVWGRPPPPGVIDPGGPNRPGPPVVHCLCVRLVGDRSVPCCP